MRAFTPRPGAWFEWEAAGRRERIKVLSAQMLDDGDHMESGAKPGTVMDTALDHTLTIACGEGALRISRLQRPGKLAMDAESFLRGFPIPPHTVLPED